MYSLGTLDLFKQMTEQMKRNSDIEEKTSILYVTNFHEDEAPNLKKIVIAVHGFNSSKESTVITALLPLLKERNIGLLAFDLPSHGDNNKHLSIDNCIDDIRTVEGHLRGFNRSISFFSSSFGAYLTLLHLMDNTERYDEVVLRVPVIDPCKAFGHIRRRGVAVDDELYFQMRENDVLENTGKIKEMINVIYATEDEIVDKMIS